MNKITKEQEEKRQFVLTDRKKEVIGICLETFVSKGLADTTSRDLGRALKLQSGGLYYYFDSKDDAVLACAEAATIRLENEMIIPALNEVEDVDKMMKHLKERADIMAPTMKFFAQVCSSPKYRELMEPALQRVNGRYLQYAKKFADKFDCDVEEVTPYVYLCITAVSNYMIFGEEDYILPQMKLIRKEINKLKNKA